MENFKELKNEMMEIAQSISKNNDEIRKAAIKISDEISEIVKISGVEFLTEKLWENKVVGGDYDTDYLRYALRFTKERVYVLCSSCHWTEDMFTDPNFVSQYTVNEVKIHRVYQMLEHLADALEMYRDAVRRRHRRTKVLTTFLKKFQ